MIRRERHWWVCTDWSRDRHLGRRSGTALSASSGLTTHLRDVLLVQTVSFQDTQDVLPDRQRCHAVYPISPRGTRPVHSQVSCGIPPSISADLPVVNDFHHGAPRLRACSAAQSIISAVFYCQRSSKRRTHLVRTKEEDLRIGPTRNIDDRPFDSRCPTRNEQVDNGL